MQQPIRKQVGRSLTMSRRLAHLEDLASFFQKKTRMDHLPKSKETISRFEKLLAALAASKTDFAVVGGLAIIFNGYPRLTLDADILVHAAPENLRRLLQCLEQWGEGFARELKPEDFVFEAGAVRVTEDFDLDIFTRMRDKSLDDFRPQLRYLEMSGVRIPPSVARRFDFSQAGFLARQGQIGCVGHAVNSRSRRQTEMISPSLCFYFCSNSQKAYNYLHETIHSHCSSRRTGRRRILGDVP
ncbi:MAG: hypothetical protein WDM76_13900 [Limisphaerales bacterium]